MTPTISEQIATMFDSFTSVVTAFTGYMTQVITWMIAQPLVLLFLGILILGLVFKYVRSVISGL
jgi:divalent metal cation (Fe/Co/Zn/Cd) transporter